MDEVTENNRTLMEMLEEINRGFEQLASKEKERKKTEVESSEDSEAESSEDEEDERDGNGDRDAKEAEGLTPSESVSYASKVAGGRTKSRSWVEEVDETDERERTRSERGGENRVKENVRSKMAEKRKYEGDETWQGEMRERRIRERNLVIREMEVKKEELEKTVGKWLEKELGKNVEVEQVWMTKEKLVFVRFGRIEDANEIAKRKKEIWERWELWVERDRTFRERRTRWMVSNRADKARRGGREVLEEEGKVCIDGNWWIWKEETEEWHSEETPGERDKGEPQEQREAREDQGTSEDLERERIKAQEEVARWREDLERRKNEIRKEEEELAAEEARVSIATGENSGELMDLGGAERIKTADENDKKTEEKGEKNRKTEKKEKEAVKNKDREPAKKGRQMREDKYGRKEKETTSTVEPETQRTEERGQTEREREKVERWREDLERRKAELRKEEEELEEEERKITATKREGDRGREDKGGREMG